METKRKVRVHFESNLSTLEISRILESMFWDGEHFEEFKDVDWEIS